MHRLLSRLVARSDGMISGLVYILLVYLMLRVFRLAIRNRE